MKKINLKEANTQAQQLALLEQRLKDLHPEMTKQDFYDAVGRAYEGKPVRVRIIAIMKDSLEHQIEQVRARLAALGVSDA